MVRCTRKTRQGRKPAAHYPVELGRRCDSADRRREQQRFAAIEREKLQAEGERKALIVHAENVRAETCIDNIEIGENELAPRVPRCHGKPH